MNDEVGDLFEFWSPGAILEYIKSVAQGYDALHADFTDGSTLDSANAKAWAIVYGNFKKFQKSTGYLSALSLSAMRTAEEYARQLVYWRDMYEKKSGRPATGATVVIPSAEQQVSINKLVVIGGLALAGYLILQGMQFVPRRT